MEKSPAMHWLGLVVWGITAVTSIVVGLKAFGFDILQTEFMLRYYTWENPLRYIIGASGAISIVMMIMHLMHGCRCGSSCTCGNR